MTSERAAEETKTPRVVAISGASGLVGQALTRHLEGEGCRVEPLVRPASSKGDGIPWEPSRGVLDPADLDGVEAVVHLAGENIFGRWNEAKKKRILDSRVKGTRLIAETLAGLERPPRVLVSASAIGFYGDRGDEVLTEHKGNGDGFLAEVTWRWEGATAAAREAGIRVVNLRIGIVLSRHGGALEQMLTPFRLGVGGRLGSGRQWFSWIHLDDLVSAIDFLLEHDIEGPVNAVAPTPVRNADLTRQLGRILRRPTILPVPSAALKLVFGGEMAEETLLASTRVRPQVLEEAGFDFESKTLEQALRRELG